MSFLDNLLRGAEEGWERAKDLLHGDDFLDVLSKTKDNLEDEKDDFESEDE